MAVDLPLLGCPLLRTSSEENETRNCDYILHFFTCSRATAVPLRPYCDSCVTARSLGLERQLELTKDLLLLAVDEAVGRLVFVLVGFH